MDIRKINFDLEFLRNGVIFTEKTLEKKIGNTTFVINSYENGRKTLREIVRDSIRREIELNLKMKIN